MAFDGTFRHVGYVVDDLDRAVERFAMLFDLDPTTEVDLVPPADVPSPTRFAFFEVGGCVFELIHPVDEPFVTQLGPDGIRIDHVAFGVRDLDAEVARLATEGIHPGHVTPDGPIGMPRQRMCYFDGAPGEGHLLVELVQPNDPDDDRRW